MKRNNTLMNTLRVDARDAATILRFLSEKKMSRPKSMAELMRTGFEGFADIVRSNYPELHVEGENEAIELLNAYSLLGKQHIIKGNLIEGLKMNEGVVLNTMSSENNLLELLAKAEARVEKEKVEKAEMKKRGE